MGGAADGRSGGLSAGSGLGRLYLILNMFNSELKKWILSMVIQSLENKIAAQVHSTKRAHSSTLNASTGYMSSDKFMGCPGAPPMRLFGL
jgi:hypothetical protein